MTWRSSVPAAMLAGGIVLSGATDPIRFIDVTREAGIDFLHINGASPDKHLVETMGSGGLFFDYDNDGWLDIFLVDGGSLADPVVARKARHRLYHNRGNGTFEDTTLRSNIRHSGYGMGACAGDVDNDGWIDLYVTSFGGNVLYRNRGDGTFADVTQSARLAQGGAAKSWSASCAFADLDKDGDLDLFVTNYVDIDPRRSPFCGNAKLGIRSYCHPLEFATANRLYRNDGRGVFTDVSGPSGIAAHRGNSLGVVITDYDGDSWPDIVVAKQRPNSCFATRTISVSWRPRSAPALLPRRTGRRGRAWASSGIDGDGRLIPSSPTRFQTHSLFGTRQGCSRMRPAKASGSHAAFVGSAPLLDADNDGQLDLDRQRSHLRQRAAGRSGATYAQAAVPQHDRAPLHRIGRAAGRASRWRRFGAACAISITTRPGFARDQ